MALQQFSREGSALVDGEQLVEAASLGVILKAAEDISRPDRKRLSESKKNAKELLSQDSITLSAVGFSRDDIASLRDVDAGHGNSFRFRVSKKNGFQFVKVNPDADEEVLFDRDKWEKQRLSALDTAIAQGANIISFGETDYQEHSDRACEEKFQEKIKAKIDAVERPIFLIAGTDYDHEENEAASTCLNRARIFPNKTLLSQERDDIPSRPILHPKLHAAERTDERISSPERPRIVYYETILGNIAVLICVDAYNPTVVMSLLRNRGSLDKDQIDFILVPSYNKSAKLFYACQVLSLLSGSVVMLIDTCGKEATKPAQTAVFVHGRLFSDLLEDPDVGLDTCGEYLSEDPHSPVRTCRLSLDFLRELRSKETSLTPTFNQVVHHFLRAP